MTHPFDSPAEPEIILDLSRLLSRISHPTPTGVDRCEMAYARELLACVPDRLSFAAVHPTGLYGRLHQDAVLRFLDLTEERWASRGFRSIWDKRRFMAGTLAALRPRLLRQQRATRARFYLQASPHNLTRPNLVRHILAAERARFICLVHDLIPLEFPEYGRADGAAKHRARVRTIVDHASGIITNSHATLTALHPWIDQRKHPVHAVVAHLGTHVHPIAPTFQTADGRPYFVCIGTIEPRKNHLLLLHIWRRMSEERGGSNIPKLILIGRRGWENEQVVDLLERCRALQDCVEEHNQMPDAQAAHLLANARALLLPSFAEGYGMPVTEALALNVPVLCSDLPALREAGRDAANYLDPLDGPGWQKAIDDLSDPVSPFRLAQADRLRVWRPSTWSEHIAIVLQLLHKLDHELEAL